MSTGEQRVGRSWGATVAWVVATLVLTGLSYWSGRWAWNDDGWADFIGWPGAVLAGIGALIALVGIFTASGGAKCPRCGDSISGFDATEAEAVVLCEGCKGYAEIQGGTLRAVADDRVYPRAVFTCELPPGEVRWPGCALCGGAPTRELTHELSESQTGKNVAASAAGVALFAVARTGFIQTGGGKVWRVPVPYCDGCSEGVQLNSELGTQVVQFRSHAVFVAFCRANFVEPRDVPAP
jgi:hypothetical protein